MLYSFKLPLIGGLEGIYSIVSIYASEDQLLSRGCRILDLKIDMQSSLAHDCPSINFYRLVMLESMWLRKIFISPGEATQANSLIGIFTSDQYEDIEDDLPFQRDQENGT